MRKAECEETRTLRLERGKAERPYLSLQLWNSFHMRIYDFHLNILLTISRYTHRRLPQMMTCI